MFTAYLDASGTHKESPVLTIAGFLAKTGTWKTFQSEWDDILRTAGLLEPDGPGYFHMTDFESSQGPYKQWSSQKRIFVLTKLIQAIAGRVELAVSSSLVVKDYKQAQTANQPLSNMTPFAFCMRKNFLLIEQWADRHAIQEFIAYVFESGDGYGREMDAFQRGIKMDSDLRKRFRFDSFTSASKKSFNPLQTADLLAYESQKEMLNCHYLQREIRPVRKSAIRLFEELEKKDVECIGEYANEKSFKLEINLD